MLFPYVRTKRTTLRPMHASDAVAAYDTLRAAGVGALPRLEAFTRRHGENIAAQFLVEQRGEVAGISSLHHLDQNSRHVRFDLLVDPDRARHGVGVEATLLTTNYAFAMWNLRKVYFWADTATPAGFNPNQPLVKLEATLPQHIDNGDGEPSDAYVFALYRDQWDQHGFPMLQRLVPDQAVSPAGTPA